MDRHPSARARKAPTATRRVLRRTSATTSARGPLDEYISKAKDSSEPVAGKKRRIEKSDRTEKDILFAAESREMAIRQLEAMEERKMAEWLNSLPDRSSQALFQLMLNEAGGGHKTKSTLSASEHAALRRLRHRDQDCPRNGVWYVKWAQHRVSRLQVPENKKTGSKEHPRWHIRPDGANSVADRIRVQVGREALARLRSIVGAGKQARLLVHHVAYAGMPGKRGKVSIPLDVGSGASISHLCDTRGCVEPSHLVATPAHVDRQHCSGVTLVVHRDAIIHEVPCRHSLSRDGCLSSESIASSCRRLMIVRLPDVAVSFIVAKEFDEPVFE